MTYLTGAFTGIDAFSDVFQKLKDFATGDGWTADGAYPNMQLSKGNIHAALNFDTSPVVNDEANTGTVNLADYRIQSYLCDGFPVPTVNPYPDHALVNDYCLSNDWTPPYARYWFFSGAVGDPAYIYMIVQKANGNFCTFMVGKLDQKGVGYEGGEFINGVFWNWWFQVGSSTGPGYGSGQGSDPFNNHYFPGDLGENYNLRIGVKDGAVATALNGGHPFTSHRAGGFGIPYPSRTMAMLQRGGKPTAMESYGAGSLRWMGHIAWLGPNPINGLTPLFEVPKCQYHAANDRFVQMGVYPGYRMCSMIGRLETEQVSYGSDNFIIFPIKRFQPYMPEPFSSKSVTSGPYGHAFKINA